VAGLGVAGAVCLRRLTDECLADVAEGHVGGGEAEVERLASLGCCDEAALGGVVPGAGLVGGRGSSVDADPLVAERR
jgi:hypothetical protein